MPDKGPVLDSEVGSLSIHLTFEKLIDSALFMMLFQSFLCTNICGDDFIGSSICGLNICHLNSHALMQKEAFEHPIIQYLQHDSCQWFWKSFSPRVEMIPAD